MPADNDAKASLTQITLSEFSALRGEIGSRTSAQHTLINLNITAVAAVGGLVLSNKGDPFLLLLLPMLSPALGMLYIDHAINIMNIGTYIQEELWRRLRDIIGGHDLANYEQVIDQYERRRGLRLLLFGVPIFVMFAGVPIGSLFGLLSILDAVWKGALWIAGLLLTLAYLCFWVIFMVKPSWGTGPPRETSS